jgi:hypothetical protein
MGSHRDYDVTDNGAIEQPDGSWLHDDGDIISWYNEAGEYHRADGPAVIFSDGIEFWWLNGIPYSFDDWLLTLNKPDETKMILRLQYE